MRVSHIIVSLEVGGGQNYLCKILARLDPAEFQFDVISLIGSGPAAANLKQMGASVHALHMTRGAVPHPGVLARLIHRLRKQRAQAVQCWLYHANVIGGLAARLAGNIPVAWNVCHSTLDPGIDSSSTLRAAHACKWLSRYIPRHIVFDSETARSVHRQAGFPNGKLQVIPNGFDLDRFRPSSPARSAVRTELGLGQEIPLVGLFGRFHPHKDHATFLQGAAAVAASHATAHFVMAGSDVDEHNLSLSRWIEALGLRRRVHLLGIRQDMPRLQASLDVAVCSSATESFPNVIGEAMACAVPCVVTDVGDCRPVVGDTGLVVRPCDPAALGQAILRLLHMSSQTRGDMGQAARRRIGSRYDIQHVADGYADMWREIAAAARRGRPTAAISSGSPTQSNSRALHDGRARRAA